MTDKFLGLAFSLYMKNGFILNQLPTNYVWLRQILPTYSYLLGGLVSLYASIIFNSYIIIFLVVLLFLQYIYITRSNAVNVSYLRWSI